MASGSLRGGGHVTSDRDRPRRPARSSARQGSPRLLHGMTTTRSLALTPVVEAVSWHREPAPWANDDRGGHALAWLREHRGQARNNSALRRCRDPARAEEPRLLGVLVPQPSDRLKDQPRAGRTGTGRVRQEALQPQGRPRRAGLRRRGGRRVGRRRTPIGAALRAVHEDPPHRRLARLVAVVHPSSSRPPRQRHLPRPARRCRGVRAVTACAGDRGLSGRQQGQKGRPHDGLHGHPHTLRASRLHQGRGHGLGLRWVPPRGVMRLDLL